MYAAAIYMHVKIHTRWQDMADVFFVRVGVLYKNALLLTTLR
jgi:hypothetical protein